MSKMYAFGVDIGGTTIKMGLFETIGVLCDKWEFPTDTSESGKNILPAIAKVIEETIKKRNIEKNDIQGVGIGVPGPVLNHATVQKCLNLGWGTLNVKTELEKLIGLSVTVENDANVAALGEMWQGGGKGHDNVVMVTLGTGVGGGVIVDGKVLSGVFGAGGEIGHLKVNFQEEELCGCGKKGCLEQYASATGLVRITTKMLADNTALSVLNEIKNLTAKDILDAAKEGDEVAVKAIEKMGLYLGIALANISCICDPKIYVVGGGVSKAGTILTDTIKKYFLKYAFHASEKAEFALATLGNDAGIYGCIKLLLSTTERNYDY